jgi:hypothetical protein
MAIVDKLLFFKDHNFNKQVKTGSSLDQFNVSSIQHKAALIGSGAGLLLQIYL